MKPLHGGRIRTAGFARKALRVCGSRRTVIHMPDTIVDHQH
jgi:hypothetical protein